MNYVTELLEEQKELLTEEMRFAEGEELEQTKQRMTDVVDALNKLSIHVVGKSLKVDIQHFDLTDCPYQINTFLEEYKIEKDKIISFSRSDKYLTMVYETF